MTAQTADTSVEKKLPTLKEATVTATAIIDEHSSIAKDGTVTIGDNLFIKTLPEGITGEIVEAVRKADATFVAAVPNAIGNQAVKAFGANKDLKEISATVDMLGGKAVEVHVRDQVTYPGIKGADGVAGPSTTKYGVLTVKVEEASNRGSVGELGKVKTLVQDQAARALAKANK